MIYTRNYVPVRTRHWIAICGAFACMMGTTAQAQKTGFSGDMTDLANAMGDVVQAYANTFAMRIKLRFADSVQVTVNAASQADRRVSVTLANKSNDTVYAALYFQYPPLPVAIDPMEELLATDTLGAKLAAEAARYDSLGKRWSLAGWMQDVPKGIWLLPREKRTLSFSIGIPESAPPGDYSAHLVAATVLVRPPVVRHGRATSMGVYRTEGQSADDAWNAEASEAYIKYMDEALDSHYAGPGYARTAGKVVVKVGNDAPSIKSP